MFTKIFNTKMGRKWFPIGVVAVILLALSGNFMGCEPEDVMFTVDCNDCYGIAPDSANLIIHVTINATYDSVPLAFYKGPYENGEIDWLDTATSENFYLYSEMDREYAVKATYISENDSIIAFDGDKMFISSASEECGSPCYIVKGGIFDLTLID
ncbi:MAG: hypothetical protein DRI70_04725 [Bacteroidetes bacterium]|nr:MAG: hypothetical protein DRI70_04725 [Bacteroidota bacterium]